MMGILLDTCALLWVMTELPITPNARTLINESGKSGNLWVSPISAWEIAAMARKSRINIAADPEDWFAAALATPGMNLAELLPRVLIRSQFLPGTPPNDPSDRIIIATARSQNLTIVTRDRKILAYGELGHALVLAC